ncbi:thiamine pyrophosphate-dependent enzyme [Brevibacillus invocatus]|uniref:thiamine pyrophosphate-dependent enzyme n=1 Tax=Brevibacillus invocatus TaxID=173959 RepID=UPI00203EC765|nr:thiamine pyrophosphate-dependent enzyme [Brevibacillus invocatus]MCM3078587.1 thiamine pyrophosphate-dependent enzyme [Brevibacillus invocatus]MCM3429164.1 thiamine pyrophosphate-dependent enzyme [Brevibacillus invocatus]
MESNNNNFSTRPKGAKATLVKDDSFFTKKRFGFIFREEKKIKEAYYDVTRHEDLLSPGNSACLGCHAELALRTTLRILGPNTILAIPPGCMGGIGVVGFQGGSGTKIPVFFPLLDNTAAMLAGIKRQYQREGRDVNVVAFAGDGGTADAGFQSLSGAAERGENIIYICYDNEAYMNTGVQRSGTTPKWSWTQTTPVGEKSQGKSQKGKDMPMIMAAHNIPYVATANPSFLPDYIDKLKKAMQVKNGMSYIHLYSGCPTGWKFPTEKTIEVGKLAVETNLYPLWECVEGKFRMTYEVKKRTPIEEYTRSMQKYAHLTDEEIRSLQYSVDQNYKRLKDLCRIT